MLLVKSFLRLGNFQRSMMIKHLLINTIHFREYFHFPLPFPRLQSQLLYLINQRYSMINSFREISYFSVSFFKKLTKRGLRNEEGIIVIANLVSSYPSIFLIFLNSVRMCSIIYSSSMSVSLDSLVVCKKMFGGI